jgi:hypothetical protein
MPEGELRLSATASAPGLKREDFDGGPLQPALMQHPAHLTFGGGKLAVNGLPYPAHPAR